MNRLSNTYQDQQEQQQNYAGIVFVINCHSNVGVSSRQEGLQCFLYYIYESFCGEWNCARMKQPKIHSPEMKNQLKNFIFSCTCKKCHQAKREREGERERKKVNNKRDKTNHEVKMNTWHDFRPNFCFISFFSGTL